MTVDIRKLVRPTSSEIGTEVILKKTAAVDDDDESMKLAFAHSCSLKTVTSVLMKICTSKQFSFYAPQLVPAGTAEARISYGDSVRLSVRHKPVPNQAQVR